MESIALLRNLFVKFIFLGVYVKYPELFLH